MVGDLELLPLCMSASCVLEVDNAQTCSSISVQEVSWSEGTQWTGESATHPATSRRQKRWAPHHVLWGGRGTCVELQARALARQVPTLPGTRYFLFEVEWYLFSYSNQKPSQTTMIFQTLLKVALQWYQPAPFALMLYPSRFHGLMLVKCAYMFLNVALSRKIEGCKNLLEANCFIAHNF